MKRNENNGQFVANEIYEGYKNNRWTAISYSHKNNGGIFWNFVCECGVYKPVSVHRVMRGDSKSCGCLRFDADYNKTHGLRNHPLYGVWRSMKGRCYNPNLENYPDYGGRGIIVCDEWKNDFKKFYDDMIDGYVKGAVELDRFPDNDGNYFKENCRWATPVQNQNNKRTSKYLTLNGIVRTAAEWGRYLGIKDDTIRRRKEKGYSDEECLSINYLPTKTTKNQEVL